MLCLGGDEIDPAIRAKLTLYRGLRARQAPWLKFREVAFVSRVLGICNYLLALNEDKHANSIASSD
jgi:hypothetical protein